MNHSFCDLGLTPLSNAFVAADALQEGEMFFPLQAFVCATCFLVQVQEFRAPKDIFTHYGYFSSISNTWLEHVKNYSELMIERFHLTSTSQVVEVASNDGYLLQFFKKKGIPVLGIEPAANVAKAAVAVGIPTRTDFFGSEIAKELKETNRQADLLVANNVLAHVPDLHDFVSGLKIVLKAGGILTLEFPHLMQLIRYCQFDTIYHEHFSYFSLETANRILTNHGLAVFDVEELSTHGGSLRIFVCHEDDRRERATASIEKLRSAESQAGLDKLDVYSRFDESVRQVKKEFLGFLIEAKQKNKKIAGYGAPAKATTLLNYCGVKSDFIDFTVDRSEYKQGRFVPGVRIPICAPEMLKKERPDYVVIFPWNLKEEVVRDTGFIRDWNGRHVIPLPHVEIL